jgi:NAD(P)H dehydrogenase (quinone)
MRTQTDNRPAPGRKHAVILCHPDPRSFNAAMAQTYCDAVCARHFRCEVRDLYALNFDPVLKAEEQPSARPFIASSDVATELAVLQDADVIVLVYPIWFGTPPAMMKGYVERVLGAGFGHRLMGEPNGQSVVAGKHLVSMTTSGNSIQWLEGQGAWLSLRTVFDTYLANAFSMASNVHLHLSGIVEGMEDHTAREELFRVTEFADSTCARLLVSVPRSRVSAQ